MQMGAMDIIRNKSMAHKPAAKWMISAGAVVLAICGAVQIGAAPVPGWLATFTQTAKGSFIVGNANAPRKLTEYASYTCSHCAAFEATEAPKIKAQLIANGKTSFEIRNLVRDQYDLTLAMLAHCGGKAKFFGNHRYLMANQNAILARTDLVTLVTLQKLKSRDLDGFLIGAYTDMKLHDFTAKRGITDRQAKICLSDTSTLHNILNMTDEAVSKYGINATPTILVDDKVAEDAHDFASIKKYLALKLI
jgi:protein-disulfide isomerase